MVGGPSLAEDAPQAEAEARPEKAARHSGRLLVRMPATLHDELARAAETEGVSLNQLITGVLASAVGWRTPGDETRGAPRAGRMTRIVLVANLVVLALAAIAAMVLLVIALRDGF
jgi:hypothetical protein